MSIIRTALGTPLLIVGGLLMVIGMVALRYSLVIRHWSFKAGDKSLAELLRKLGSGL